MYFRQALIGCVLLLLTGCGVIDYFFLPPPEDTAQELFENANDAMREKNYRVAAIAYQKLKDSYPFSPYTIEAELALGDAYYLNEDYLGAVEAYKDFESLHPRHEAIPYVLYQVGMSNLRSFISIDRPTTQIQESIEFFSRLRETFPQTEYAGKAADEIKNARKILAEHEMYLADVFWQMEKYGPAWRRYVFIVETYPDVEDVRDHAKEKALAAFYRYRTQESEKAREEITGTWKSWFDWL